MIILIFFFIITDLRKTHIAINRFNIIIQQNFIIKKPETEKKVNKNITGLVKTCLRKTTCKNKQNALKHLPMTIFIHTII